MYDLFLKSTSFSPSDPINIYNFKRLETAYLPILY